MEGKIQFLPYLKPAFKLNDFSFWVLLASNAFVILLAVLQQWNLSDLLWIYWWQSIIIGFFNFIRILTLKEFSTEGFTLNNRPVEPDQSTKIFTAGFFFLHYGFFHYGYFSFLSMGQFIPFINIGSPDKQAIFFAVIIFFGTHLFSFIYNRNRDAQKQNIGVLMMYPYARIMPMHLFIMFGIFAGKAALPFFLVLKTLADIGMHGNEHVAARKIE